MDTGQHYRYEYKGVKLDPFRIAKIYSLNSFAMQTILKKCLCAGNRGHKELEEDIKDIRDSALRKLQMLDEDKVLCSELK